MSSCFYQTSNHTNQNYISDVYLFRLKIRFVSYLDFLWISYNNKTVMNCFESYNTFIIICTDHLISFPLGDVITIICVVNDGLFYYWINKYEFKCSKIHVSWFFVAWHCSELLTEKKKERQNHKKNLWIWKTY